MKKSVIAIFMSVLLVATGVFANGSLPTFLTDIPLNYTEDLTVSVTFDSSDDIIVLLNEMEIPKEVENFVDLQSLIKSLLSYEGKMFLQADMSENFDKIKLALTSESLHKININPNANVDVDLKMGLWLNADLSNESKPVFDMIVSYPYFNKYLKITADDIFTDESVYGILKAVFSKEYLEYVQDLSVDLFAEYATIEGSGNEYKVTMDNEAFCNYLDRIMVEMPQLLSLIAPEADESAYLAFPSFKGWQILGEDGIECVYKLKNGKISAEIAKVDICIDISKAYTALTGMEWDYESKGLLDFNVEASANLSKFNSTKVEFPVLTPENTMTMDDLMPDYNIEAEAQVPVYPQWFTHGESDKLPVIDGQVYLPLRQALVGAYEDTVEISYDNGTITAVCEYFPGYSELVIAIDSPVAYTDGAQHTVAAPVIVDGTTYVSNQLLADMLGLGLSDAWYDLVNDVYSYSIYATIWNE